MLKRSKAIMRSTMLAHLKTINVESRSEASKRLHDRVTSLPQYTRAQSIGLFLSMPHEIDTHALIATSLRLGKRVFVPRVVGKSMLLLELYSVAEIETFQRTKWGIPEPPANGRACLEQEDAATEVLIILPGVAFDTRGGRVGYGGGFYDRYLRDLLERRRRFDTLGIGFAFQLVDQVIPIEPHDVKIDRVIVG